MIYSFSLFIARHGFKYQLYADYSLTLEGKLREDGYLCLFHSLLIPMCLEQCVPRGHSSINIRGSTPAMCG